MNNKYFFTSVFIYLASGMLSLDIVINSVDAIYSGVIPGLFFILATLLSSAVCDVPLKKKDVIVYFILLYAAYLLLFSDVVFSGDPDLLMGSLTFGTGAVVAVYCYHSFIKKIGFHFWKSFVCGAMAFIAVTGLEASELISVLSGDRVLFFLIVGLLWQLLVGSLIAAQASGVVEKTVSPAHSFRQPYFTSSDHHG